MGVWLRRLVYMLRHSRQEADLREEIEIHRALRAAQLERDGLTPQNAAAASHRALGNVLLAREEARDTWTGSWATWSQDVRYGLRMFASSPGFTAVAVLTLALGIGLNAGIFSVINGVLVREPPVPDAHELVSMSRTVEGVPQRQGALDVFSLAEYRAYRDRARTLSGLLAYAGARGETAVAGGAPQTVYGALVSCNYFDVLRQPPALGRALAPRDCEPGAEPAVVIGHDLWSTAFTADPGIVGDTIQLNRQHFTVVGVAAPGTYGGSFLRVGYFAPLGAGRLLAPGDSRAAADDRPWLYLLGRREAGIGDGQLKAELDLITAQIDREQPGRSTTLTAERARAMAVPPGLRGAATGAAAVLMAAFGCILLIACANVANLLLARGTARSHEIGIRLALGASRARVVRQLLTESLLLSLAGGLLGCVVALWSVRALVSLVVPALLPPELPISLALDVSPDLRVLSFAVLLTVGTGILFGLAPALHVSRRDLQAVMKQDAAGAGSSRGGGRLRGALVGVQVALCMTLMIAASLLVRGLHATYTVDPGFDYRDVAYLSFEPVLGAYSSGELAALRRRVAADVQALPGVHAVAYADREPLGDDVDTIALRLPDESTGEARVAQLNAVTPEYFQLLGLPIVRGRTFTEREVGSREAGGARAAIITESTARNLWPDREPIDRILQTDRGTLQVVGVAADAQVTAIGEIDPYYVYVPGGGAVLLVRSEGGFAATAAGIQRLVRAIDPALALTVFPLESSLGWWRGVSATVTSLGGGLGLLALVMASVGIYGLVSYAVMGRYREIGIRMALGATERRVLGMVLRQTMRPVVIGAAFGIAAATATSRIVSSVLFGVSPADPLAFAGAALLVLGIALAAGIMAARPATRTDPISTLRVE